MSKNELSYIENIAKVCHEANREWCEANGDMTQAPWIMSPKWQKDSAIEGVEFKLNNPTAKADSQHNAWMKHKTDDGWKYGEEKNHTKKTHPCILPFNELPEFQQKKDKLFSAIVEALR